MTAPPEQVERERILAAYIGLVSENGYDSTSLAAVLERAGADQEAFHRSFEDEDDCFRQAWDYVGEHFMEKAIVAVAEQTEWREQLRAVGIAIVDCVTERPSHGRMLFIDGPAAQVRNRLPLDDPNMEMFVELVDAGRRQPGAAEHLTRATAEGLVGAVHQRIAVCLLEGSIDELRLLLPQLMSVVVLPYLGNEASQEELRRGYPS